MKWRLEMDDIEDEEDIDDVAEDPFS